MSGRRFPLTTLALLVIAAAIALAVSQSRGGGEGSTTPGGSPELPAETNFEMSEEELAGFNAFPVYGLGRRFEGLERRAILRRDYVDRLPGVDAPPRINRVNVVYGTCELPATGERRCAPPLQVTTLRECSPDRGVGTRGRRPPSLESIRGTRAAWYANGPLEVYVGRETVRIFGRRDLAFAAARDLRAENGLGGAAGADEALPPPTEDAPRHTGVPCASR